MSNVPCEALTGIGAAGIPFLVTPARGLI